MDHVEPSMQRDTRQKPCELDAAVHPGQSKVFHLEYPHTGARVVIKEGCMFLLRHLLDFLTVPLLEAGILDAPVGRPAPMHCHGCTLVQALTHRWLQAGINADLAHLQVHEAGYIKVGAVREAVEDNAAHPRLAHLEIADLPPLRYREGREVRSDHQPSLPRPTLPGAAPPLCDLGRGLGLRLRLLKLLRRGRAPRGRKRGLAAVRGRAPGPAETCAHQERREGPAPGQQDRRAGHPQRLIRGRREQALEPSELAQGHPFRVKAPEPLGHVPLKHPAQGLRAGVRRSEENGHGLQHTCHRARLPSETPELAKVLRCQSLGAPGQLLAATLKICVVPANGWQQGGRMRHSRSSLPRCAWRRRRRAGR
mmetsp:Transcript_45597/g.130091  ORF Transcript_45597/g.130091 Transcript_45597/m.130091 type:complete len:366 (+) Transcript_45597:295-1392(+)